MKFRIGDRVILNQSAGYINREYDPYYISGTIYDIINNNKICVEWDNQVINTYDERDLIFSIEK